MTVLNSFVNQNDLRDLNFISKFLDACYTLTCGLQVFEAKFSLTLSTRITLNTQFKQVTF